MSIQQAYNYWAEQYDSNLNKTRDLEAVALKETLKDFKFISCLEIGCGTGKNTEWLIEKANKVTAVDFSEQMLSRAKEKINSEKVTFIQADITKPWSFAAEHYDLITFSLVLEHINNLDHIFSQASKCLNPGGIIYVGELHPYKQYTGSKARFETEEGLKVLECFNHHISDFTEAAKKYGFSIKEFNELFDDNDRNKIPRVMVLVLKKIV